MASFITSLAFVPPTLRTILLLNNQVHYQCVRHHRIRNKFEDNFFSHVRGWNKSCIFSVRLKYSFWHNGLPYHICSTARLASMKITWNLKIPVFFITEILVGFVISVILSFLLSFLLARFWCLKWYRHSRSTFEHDFSDIMFLSRPFNIKSICLMRVSLLLINLSLIHNHV